MENQFQSQSQSSNSSRIFSSGERVSDILAREVNLLEIASRYVKDFKPAGSKGGAEMKGTCPFHDDGSPSLYVNSSKGFFKCQGCGTAGRVLDFYAKINDMNYASAGRELCKEFGISSMSGKAAAPMDPAFKLIQNVASKFASTLEKSSKASGYAKERGLDEAIIKKFGIGYSFGNEFVSSPKWEVSRETVDLAEKAGLIIKNEDGSAYHYMKDRLIFPVKDKSGMVVGFGGRIIGENAAGPKYRNSPETEWFKKSELLYGIYESKNGIQQCKEAIVVEGYMDVVGLHMYGVDNVVSPMGTAVSENAFEQLWSMTKRIVFCLDGDKAGIDGTLRSILKAAPGMRDGSEIAVVSLPNGVDPDEFVAKHGADAFDDLCSTAMPLSKYFAAHVESEGKLNMDSAEGRTGFIKAVEEFAMKFKNAPILAEQIICESKAIALGHMIGMVMNSKMVDAPIEEIENALELLKSSHKKKMTPSLGR